MSDRIIHRGPDDEGYLTIGETEKSGNGELKNLISIEAPVTGINIGLAQRRLSIQDLSALGRQPMTYRERYWITFNGEVYNYIELREELAKAGYDFVSHTDTEVVMAAYDYWGKDCLSRFNGMWAFVLVDLQEGKVLMSRDRFGIKPLYYHCDNGTFVFASEIKAILEYPGVPAKPSLSYCKNYLKNGPSEYIRETAFESIFRLGNASYAECSLADLVACNFTEHAYWTLEYNNGYDSFSASKAETYALQYKKLLADAVRLRLRADVNIGSALSGGLDSSSIVYLINDQLKQVGKTERQDTFSCVYKQPGTTYCDESVYVDQLADFLDVRSNQIEPQADDIIEAHRKMIYHMDTPPEGTCMSGWHTFKCVKDSGRVTITLDGQGADEMLAGYPHYISYYLMNLKKWDLIRQIPSFLSQNKYKREVLKGIAGNFFPKRFGREALNKKLFEDFFSHLITLIHYSDRVSMAHSIESRMPFMDYRFVELIHSIPFNYKMHNGWSKYLSRLVFNDTLPDNIVWRKDKMGWPIPENYWFRGPLKETFVSTIRQSEFLQTLGAGGDIEKEIEADGHIGPLIRLYNLAVWHRIFFNDERKN